MSDFLTELLSGKGKKEKLSFQEHFDFFKKLKFTASGANDFQSKPPTDDFIYVSPDIDLNLEYLRSGSLVNADQDYSNFEVPVWEGEPKNSQRIAIVRDGQPVKVFEIEDNSTARIEWFEGGTKRQGFVETKFLKSFHGEEGRELQEVVISPMIHIGRIENLIRQYKGYWGIRRGLRRLKAEVSDDDIDSEIVLMLSSLESREQEHFIENKPFMLKPSVSEEEEDEDEGEKLNILDEVCGMLNARQLARGIANHKYSLEKKIEILEKTGDKEIEYQFIRPILLSSPEGIKKDNALKDKLDPDDDIKIADLKKSDLSGIENDKDDEVVFDDQKEDEQIIMSEDERNLLLFLAKRAQAYKRYVFYDQKLSIAKGFKKNKEKLIQELEEIGYTDISSFEKDIKEKKEEYLNAFQLYAVKTAFNVLDESERAIKDQSNELLKRGIGDQIRQVLKSQEGLYDKVKSEEEELRKLGARISNYSGNNAGNVASLPLMVMNTQKDLTKYREINQSLRSNQVELRQKLGQRFPIFLDPRLNLTEIYDDYVKGDGLSDDLVEKIREGVIDKFENIEKAKANLRDDPEMVWRLEPLMNLTLARTNVLQEDIFDSIIQEKIKSVKATNDAIQNALLALSIGLVIVSFGSLSPASAAIVGGLGLAVNALDFYVAFKDYQKLSPASNTSFDPQEALSGEDPSVVFVVLAAAGVFGEAFTVADAVRKTEYFAILGQTSLKNLHTRKETILKRLEKSFNAGKLTSNALKRAEDFFEYLEALNTRKRELLIRFLDKIPLDDFNLAWEKVMATEAGNLSESIMKGEISGSKLEEEFTRMITVATFENRGRKALGNIAQTGKNVEEFKDLLKSIPGKGLSKEAENAFSELVKKLSKMDPEEAGKISDFLVQEFKSNPHAVNDWSGFLQAITKYAGDEIFNILETGRRFRYYLLNNHVLFKKVGNAMANFSLAEKKVFMRNMDEIFIHIKTDAALREAGLLDELVTDIEVQNFYRYNLDDPSRFKNLWKSYKVKSEGHLTFKSYIDKFEADRLGKIQKVKGEYPLNAQDYAGKSFSFDINKNRIYFDRLEAISDETEKARRLNLFNEAKKTADRLGIKEIKFDEKGFPDFTPLTYEHNGIKLKVDIKKLNPDPKGSEKDIDNANQWVKNNVDKDWMDEPSDYVWHHIENSTELVLIPKDIHNLIRHTGGRGTY